MTYETIQPPFEGDLQGMSKPELLRYKEWFHEILPHRINELAKAVKSVPGFEKWDPDFSPKSLVALGDWFRSQVSVRPRTKLELNEIASCSSFPIDIPSEELTHETFSLAMDVGMYFGEVILANLPGTYWDQPTRNKSFADYGQPVIMGFGMV